MEFSDWFKKISRQDGGAQTAGTNDGYGIQTSLSSDGSIPLASGQPAVTLADQTPGSSDAYLHQANARQTAGASGAPDSAAGTSDIADSSTADASNAAAFGSDTNDNAATDPAADTSSVDDGSSSVDDLGLLDNGDGSGDGSGNGSGNGDGNSGDNGGVGAPDGSTGTSTDPTATTGASQVVSAPADQNQSPTDPAGAVSADSTPTTDSGTDPSLSLVSDDPNNDNIDNVGPPADNSTANPVEDDATPGAPDTTTAPATAPAAPIGTQPAASSAFGAGQQLYLNTNPHSKRNGMQFYVQSAPGGDYHVYADGERIFMRTQDEKMNYTKVNPAQGVPALAAPTTAQPVSAVPAPAAPAFGAGHQLYVNNNPTSARKGQKFYIQSDLAKGGYDHVYADGTKVFITAQDEKKIKYTKAAVGGIDTGGVMDAGLGSVFPHASNYHHSDAIGSGRSSGAVVGNMLGATEGSQPKGWIGSAETPADPGSSVMAVEPHWDTDPLSSHDAHASGK